MKRYRAAAIGAALSALGIVATSGCPTLGVASSATGGGGSGTGAGNMAGGHANGASGPGGSSTTSNGGSPSTGGGGADACSGSCDKPSIEPDTLLALAGKGATAVVLATTPGGDGSMYVAGRYSGAPTIGNCQSLATATNGLFIVRLSEQHVCEPLLIASKANLPVDAPIQLQWLAGHLAVALSFRMQIQVDPDHQLGVMPADPVNLAILYLDTVNGTANVAQGFGKTAGVGVLTNVTATGLAVADHQGTVELTVTGTLSGNIDIDGSLSSTHDGGDAYVARLKIEGTTFAGGGAAMLTSGGQPIALEGLVALSDGYGTTGSKSTSQGPEGFLWHIDHDNLSITDERLAFAAGDSGQLTPIGLDVVPGSDDQVVIAGNFSGKLHELGLASPGQRSGYVARVKSADGTVTWARKIPSGGSPGTPSLVNLAVAPSSGRIALVGRYDGDRLLANTCELSAATGSEKTFLLELSPDGCGLSAFQGVGSVGSDPHAIVGWRSDESALLFGGTFTDIDFPSHHLQEDMNSSFLMFLVP